MDEFDAGGHESRVTEALEAEPRSHSLFHATVTLLDQVAQAAVRPHYKVWRRRVFSLQRVTPWNTGY